MAEIANQLPPEITITPDADTNTNGWKLESNNRLTKRVRLNATMDGRAYGKFIAEERIERDGGDNEVDRYVYLSSIYVPNGMEDPDEFREFRAVHGEDMRKVGIGTSLLRELGIGAIQFGASRIEGRVIQADILNTPGLLEFYQGRGFQLTPDEEMFKVVFPLK